VVGLIGGVAEGQVGIGGLVLIFLLLLLLWR